MQRLLSSEDEPLDIGPIAWLEDNVVQSLIDDTYNGVTDAFLVDGWVDPDVPGSTSNLDAPNPDEVPPTRDNLDDW